MSESWETLFYKELNPEKRQAILYENFRNPKTGEDRLREELWVARYGKRKPVKDAFLGYIINLNYIAESDGMDIGGRKLKLALEVIHGLHLYEYEKKEEWEQRIIYCELKNMWHRYMEVSQNGRGFTSVLFGMGQLSEEGVAQKIASQISAVVYKAPHLLGMEKEFAVLRQAATEAFREAFPNREHFLKKR